MGKKGTINDLHPNSVLSNLHGGFSTGVLRHKIICRENEMALEQIT